jgi:Peptidase family M28/Heavy metal binding domain
LFKRLRGVLTLTVLVAFTSTMVGQRRNASSKPELTDPALVRHYQQLITPESLASRLYFFASDFFEGRETATRGQRLAAHYLASQYRQLGLSPKGTEVTTDPLSASPYFQPFTVYRRTPKQARLEVIVEGNRVASSIFSADAHDDLSFFLTGGLHGVNGGVVFAGYGIADDKLGYNDYAALATKGLSVADKWVLILEDEPLADATRSLLPTADHKPSSWSTQFINKRAALWKAIKPKGVLVVSDVSPLATDSFADRATQASLNAQRIGPLSLVKTTDFPPTFAISSKLANQLLAPSGHNVAELKQQIDSSLKPVAFDLGKTVKVNAEIESAEALKTENVLALIEGSDPKLKDQVVIISAHYDHLGTNPFLKGDQVFNGAADDGSGIVACLEMAQWFMKAKRDGVGPRRSILFINFSGEEKGTLGSNFYSSAPVIPWDKTVADINMDGVGGIDAKHPTHSRNYIYVVGRDDLSSELINTTKQLNVSLGTNLELTEGRRFNSDQQNFETQLIPYIYYSTGLTEKYHQVGDEPNTVDYDHFARVVQLVFATAWRVANQNGRPTSIERSRLTLAGYVCPPCGFSCDEEVHDRPGECPVCGMALAPKYIVNRS